MNIIVRLLARASPGARVRERAGMVIEQMGRSQTCRQVGLMRCMPARQWMPGHYWPPAVFISGWV